MIRGPDDQAKSLFVLLKEGGLKPSLIFADLFKITGKNLTTKRQEIVMLCT